MRLGFDTAESPLGLMSSTFDPHGDGDFGRKNPQVGAGEPKFRELEPAGRVAAARESC
jgi:hypothetical protein